MKSLKILFKKAKLFYENPAFLSRNRLTSQPQTDFHTVAEGIVSQKPHFMGRFTCFLITAK